MVPFLADDLFLTLLDSGSGKLSLGEVQHGVMLASALLGEPLLAGNLTLTNGAIRVGGHPAPPDELAQALLAHTEKQLFTHRLSAVDWIAQYRLSAVDMVAGRLTRTGVVQPQQQRRLGRVSVRYVATDPGAVFLRSERIWAYLRHQAELGIHECVLAALITQAPGSGDRWDVDRVARAHLQAMIAELPLPLRELLAAAETATLASVGRWG
jgi:hypothetical protein